MIIPDDVYQIIVEKVLNATQMEDAMSHSLAEFARTQPPSTMGSIASSSVTLHDLLIDLCGITAMITEENTRSVEVLPS